MRRKSGFGVNRPLQNRSVLIVNCLDTLYGHALLKFLSSVRYLRQHPDFDVVAIIPSLLSWIMPSMLQSVIEVDTSLADFGTWIGGLDLAIKSLLSVYSTAFLAEAVSQPDLSTEDLSILGPEFENRP